MITVARESAGESFFPDDILNTGKSAIMAVEQN